MDAARQSTIAVLGSANMDLVVRQPRRAQPGETLFGESFATGPGGKGLNQAVAAARAGADVVFLGAVGTDPFADVLRRRLSDERIDVSRLRTVDAATGVAVIAVTDDGENSIVVVPGANADAGLDDDDRAAIARASHLVVQLERPASLLREALAFARAQGVTTVLTPAPARAGIDDLIGLADILVPNEGEARLLSGEGDADAAAVSLAQRGGTVVVTRGARGVVVADADGVRHRLPARAADVVDTTGAGDVFTGVLVARLAAGDGWPAALETATAAGALAVGRPGAADSAPTWAEIEAARA